MFDNDVVVVVVVIVADNATLIIEWNPVALFIYSSQLTESQVYLC